MEKTKIAPGVSLVDETLDLKLSGMYHLSLELGLNGMGYCIFNQETNKYLALETFTFQEMHHFNILCESLLPFIQQHPVLSKKYKTVSVAIVNSKSTLVPQALFDEKSSENMLRFNYVIEKDEVVMTDTLKGVDIKNVYALPRPFNEFISTLFRNARIIHYASPLIENTLLRYKNQSGKKVVLHVQQSHFELMVLEGKKLIFYNSFSYATAEDMVYYLLFACEQLKLNPENLELFLYGEIDRNSAIYQLLYKYIRTIKFGERAEGVEYSYKFNAVPDHFFYNLLSQRIYQ